MCAARSELSALLARARGRAILIVGDLMLDHFVMGGVERISPEAPVPVVRFDHEEYRLGGAANFAHNTAALGGRVPVVGLLGHDHAGNLLRDALCPPAVGSSVLVGCIDVCITR